MEIKEELELLWEGSWVLLWNTGGVHVLKGISSWQMLEQGVIPVHVGMESPWEKATALLGVLLLRGSSGDQKSKIIICIESLRELRRVNPEKNHAWMLQCCKSSCSLQLLGMGLKNDIKMT